MTSPPKEEGGTVDNAANLDPNSAAILVSRLREVNGVAPGQNSDGGSRAITSAPAKREIYSHFRGI
jgi:hypothetical protein